jgi:hypothetical protein
MLRLVVPSSWRVLPECSSWFLGTEVDGARDTSWRHHCFTQLYLIAKPSHVGVNVDGLAYPLHRSMVYDRQVRGQSFLSGAALSHHITVGSCAFLGVKSPGLDI